MRKTIILLIREGNSVDHSALPFFAVLLTSLLSVQWNADSDREGMPRHDLNQLLLFGKQDLDRFQRAFEGTVPQFAAQIGAPGERSAGFGAVRDAVRGSACDIGDVESGERGKQTRALQWKRIQRSTASSESPSSAFQ